MLALPMVPVSFVIAPNPALSPASAVPVLSVARALPLHVLAITLLQATGFATNFILPVLARKHFHASELQTLIVTAAPTVLFSLSIFWNDVFSRMRLSRYLLVFWCIACLPLAGLAFVQSINGLLLLHVLSCAGGAAFHPAAGDLLKSLYPDAFRGRAYGIIWASTMAAGAAMGFAVGKLLSHDPESFRVYMPIAVGVQLVGVVLLAWLGHASGRNASRRLVANDQTLYERAVEPITHMNQVLRADKVFFRYEAAYMTYGVGWMICYALLPFLVTDKLGLDYDQIAAGTHVPYYIAMVAMIFPAGMLLDRLGAMKSTGLSFAALTLHPLLLIFAMNTGDLVIASVLYGIAHAGASVGWMLGPVSLAPSPDKVPHYVAIHATLVGIRGKIFQGLGVGLYALMKHTGVPIAWALGVPLALAAGAYLWSGFQMWSLAKFVEKPRRPKALEGRREAATLKP